MFFRAPTRMSAVAQPGFPGYTPYTPAHAVSPAPLAGPAQPGTAFPGAVPQPTLPQIPAGSLIPGIPRPRPPVGDVPGLLPAEESYIENILRLNLGKMATIYMTFENNTQWNAKIFRGIIEAAGRDHIIISDPNTGTRYLLLMVNLDYITFDQPLNYTSPFQIGTVPR